jgi:hypothetical protein
MSGDAQRLTLLAEPHPATLRDGKDLNGMQEVRGSNPLSSTVYAGKRHISISDMIFGLLHQNRSSHPALVQASSHVRAPPPVPDGSHSRRRAIVPGAKVGAIDVGLPDREHVRRASLSNETVPDLSGSCPSGDPVVASSHG